MKVGCIPIFWEKFAQGIGLNNTTHMCNRRIEYQNVRNQLKDALVSFQKDISIYKQPCTTMTASITTWGPIRKVEFQNRKKLGKLYFRFYYPQGLYREIMNTKAYTSETLLGQVGGFVGIQKNL